MNHLFWFLRLGVDENDTGCVSSWRSFRRGDQRRNRGTMMTTKLSGSIFWNDEWSYPSGGKSRVSEFNDDNVDELTLAAEIWLQRWLLVSVVVSCRRVTSTRFDWQTIVIFMSDVPSSVNRQVECVLPSITRSDPTYVLFPIRGWMCCLWDVTKDRIRGLVVRLHEWRPLFAGPFVVIGRATRGMDNNGTSSGAYIVRILNKM